MKKKPTKFLTLTQNHWVFLAIVVLLIVPFLLGVFYSDQIYDLYVTTSIGPGVQRQFGFRMERKRMYYRGSQPLDVFVITNLEPTGVLAKAGVKNNDVPLASFHESNAAFYRQLQGTKKEGVVIRLIGSEEYEEWLKTGEFAFNHVRRVVIPQQAN